MSHLQPAARAEVRRQVPSVSTNAPVFEGLDDHELQMLKNLTFRKGR